MFDIIKLYDIKKRFDIKNKISNQDDDFLIPKDSKTVAVK